MSGGMQHLQRPPAQVDGIPVPQDADLLSGTKRSLLIDTGLGVCDIADEVNKLTSLPVTASSIGSAIYVLSTHASPPLCWNLLRGNEPTAFYTNSEGRIK